MLLVPPAYRSYIRNLVRICFTAETVWEKMKPFWGEKWGKGEEKYGREKKERNLSTKIKNLKKKKVTRLQFGIFFIFTKKGFDLQVFGQQLMLIKISQLKYYL